MSIGGQDSGCTSHTGWSLGLSPCQGLCHCMPSCTSPEISEAPSDDEDLVRTSHTAWIVGPCPCQGLAVQALLSTGNARSMRGRAREGAFTPKGAGACPPKKRTEAASSCSSLAAMSLTLPVHLGMVER